MKSKHPILLVRGPVSCQRRSAKTISGYLSLIIVALLFALSCTKTDVALPDRVSFAASKGNYLMQEERIRYMSDVAKVNHYYANGRLVKAISPEGPIALYAYDPAGRTVTLTYTYASGIPYGKEIFYFNESNQIIRSEFFPMEGAVAKTEYQYNDGSLVMVRTRSDYLNGLSKIDIQQCSLSGGRIREISIREEEYVNGQLTKRVDQRLSNKSMSPFVYRLYNDQGRLVRYYAFSPKYKAATYNIFIYPDVDLSTMHLSRSAVIKANGERIRLLDWYTHGMLQVEDRYFYPDGRENHWYLEDIQGNSDAQPLSYRLLFKGYADPDYIELKFEYDYIRL